MLPLQKIKIVDLREGRSVWDKAKSKPKKGQYEIEKKVYVDRRSYHQPGRSDKWFSWCRYTPDEREMNEWKMAWGYEPVVAGKDDYWPEPLTPNASGWYILGDVVLMACPLVNYLQKRKLEEEMATGGGQAVIDRFDQEMKQMGVSVPRDFIDQQKEQFTEDQNVDSLLHLIK